MARGLNTIAANIVKNKDVLAEYGIQVQDTQGNLKSTYDVLAELKPVWDNLTDAERQSLGITLAGKNQYRVLAAIMKNYAHAVEATEDAINSEGTAVQQNAAYMESLEARVTRLKALFQELSNVVVGSDLVGGFIDLSESILTFANTDFGSFVTQATLLIGAATGIYGMLSAGILGGIIPPLTEALPYIVAVSAALLGVYRVLKLVDKKLGEAAEVKAFDNVEEAIKKSQKKIEEYDNKIADAKKALMDLQTIPPAERTPEIEEEIARLHALITAYQKLKEVEEERIRTKYAQQLRGTEFVDSTGFKWSESSENRGSGFGGMRAAKYSNIPAIAEAMSKTYSSDATAIYSLAEAFATVDENMAQLLADEAPLDVLLQKLKEYDVELTHDTHTWAEELKTASTDMQHQIDLLETYPQFADDFTDATKEMLKTNKDYYDTLKTLEETGASLTPQEQEFVQIYENLKRSLAEATVGADKFAKAQDAINKVIREHSGKGEAATIEDYVQALSGIEGIDPSNVATLLQYFKEIGLIDFDETEQKVKEVAEGIQGVVNSTGTKPEIPVGAENDTDGDVEQIIDEVEAEAEEASPELTLSVTSSAEAEALTSSLQKIIDLSNTINQTKVSIQISNNVSAVSSKLSTVKTQITSMPNGSFTISCWDNASATLNSILELYNQLKDKTVNITVNKTGNADSGEPHANGTGHFKGGRALINDGSPVNGSAAELVVANGQASIFNNGQPVIVDLPPGAKIYSAEETNKILSNIQNLKSSIPAFGDGNVREPAAINANTIEYEPSEYYTPDVPDKFKNINDFKKWLKERKHLLELDLITEEQYYLDLELANENYLKTVKGAEDDYQQYQEEIYKWKKEQVGDENELLKKQIELEKALGNVAKAKAQKILVFKNGKFQYMADVDAIDQAQKNLMQVNGGYAKGTKSAVGGIHLVGEEGPELRVINQGDGIIPHNLTENLIDLAKMGKQGFVDKATQALQTIYNFSIANIELPNVSDAEGFFGGLKNYAYQYSYA